MSPERRPNRSHRRGPGNIRVMPPEHGRRLVERFPQGRLVEIADSYALIPEDQPLELARAIRDFVRQTTQAGVENVALA